MMLQETFPASSLHGSTQTNVSSTDIGSRPNRTSACRSRTRRAGLKSAKSRARKLPISTLRSRRLTVAVPWPLGTADRDRARATALKARRFDQRPDRGARADRGVRRRQAAEARARRRAGDGALYGILRRRGRQSDGRNDPLPRRLHGQRPCASRTASRGTSCRGTDPCRSLVAPSARRSRWAMPASSEPAEEACLTSLALADLGGRAGFPAGALNVVPGLGEEAGGAALAAHPGVRHLSFTGSVAVGALVQAAAARQVAPGARRSNSAAKSPRKPRLRRRRSRPARCRSLSMRASRMRDRTWSAASRILVERSRLAEVVERMAARYKALRVGPADADLYVVLLISERQKTIVARFIWIGPTWTMAAKGEIIAGAPDGGHYVAPTLFADVAPSHRLAQEEIFGRVQGRHSLRRRGRGRRRRQRNRLRSVAGLAANGRRRAGRCGSPGVARRAGVHQQLRRGRRRRAALRRRWQIGPWPREGFRGALRLLGAENGRGVAWVSVGS